MKIEEVFARRRFIMLDGAMGTQLQLRGLTTEQKPELAAFIMPDVLTAVHRDYARAGADILLANTFGANPRKLKGTGYTVQQVIEASIACARTAAQETGALVALDIGPIGELLAPAGTLPFEDACAQFAEMVRAGAAAGADLVFLETMTDLYELKAAILAAKENCDLPVFTSMSFEARGRTFTGCTVESYGITAAGLGADAVGINCSLGPKEILPFAQRLCRVVPAGMPVFVKPNAGLPRADGSGYDMCRKIKKKGDLPVIFLTAYDDEVNVVMGFDLGADDYISKPFRVKELMARIKSVLRRYNKDSPDGIVKLKELVINTNEAKVYKNKQEIVLTAMEYRLLLILLNNRGSVLSRNQLLENIWDIDGDFVEDNTLTVYIKRLRDKIEEDPANPVYIKTVRGMGYMIEND